MEALAGLVGGGGSLLGSQGLLGGLFSWGSAAPTPAESDPEGERLRARTLALTLALALAPALALALALALPAASALVGRAARAVRWLFPRRCWSGGARQRVPG